MLLAQLIYMVFCVALAYVNFLAIEANKRVYHGLNGVAHICVWCWLWLLADHWLIFLILPLLGRVVFDTTLNYFRELPLDYVSKTPKSLIDKVEQKLFKRDGIAPKILWLALALSLNILYLFIK